MVAEGVATVGCIAVLVGIQTCWGHDSNPNCRKLSALCDNTSNPISFLVSFYVCNASNTIGAHVSNHLLWTCVILITF